MRKIRVSRALNLFVQGRLFRGVADIIFVPATAMAALTPKQVELQEKLEQLTLNSTAIWERELKDGPIEAPLLIKVPYLFLCWMLDVVFEGRYVPGRFFLLETVARMPYFRCVCL